MNYGAILLAAGRGSRSGLSFNKVLYPYQGRELLWQSIDRFLQDEDCSELVIVCADDEIEDFQNRFPLKNIPFVCGGKERQDSVLAGLKQIQAPYVLIHDGARPFCSKALIERIKKALENAQGVIPGIPVVDTIKQVDENGQVISTPVRSSLRAVQTPQAFHTKTIRQALELVREKNLQVTDDAQALEVALGLPSICVEGEPGNFKVTSPADLERIEQM